MKTIRKNAFKKIQTIVSNASELKYYSLSNDFDPQSSVTNKEEIESIVTAIMKDRVNSIIQKDNGTVVFRIHSNLWIELYPKEVA
jgi:hypothetical protein